MRKGWALYLGFLQTGLVVARRPVYCLLVRAILKAVAPNTVMF